MPSAVVNTTEEVEAWLRSLQPRDQGDVQHVIKLLELMGIQLPFPHSSALNGARYGLRELRPRRGESPLRIIYAFDPHREAVILLGGDKGADKRFYDRVIPVAEALFEEYRGHLEDSNE